ncbi:MAG TPA: phosphodiester glycosidase family protein [Tepidisphaeraceae bacterium]|nr:phosphodiester glycosidase family protein [Tepidisphaeraceae bacterium]
MNRLATVMAFCFTSWAYCDAPTTQPHAAGGLPYRIAYEERSEPAQRIWTLEVDLSDPRVTVKVLPGGPDPDGEGPWQTTLAPVSKIARQEELELAVNASFFSIKEVLDEQGKKLGYREGVWSSAVGWTMTDGKQWAPRERDWPVLWVDDAGAAHITTPDKVGSGARQVVAGNTFIMVDGAAPGDFAGMMLVRHPRTAVGVNADGTRLTVLTVDGRQPGKATGMTGEELLAELQKRGVVNAINLDGGGSTTLVERDPGSGELKVLNNPSGGRERAVANVLGIDVKN